MVVAISCTEGTRNTLGVIIAIVCAFLSFAGLCLVALGIFIEKHINEELILLESYNSGVFPQLLVSTGSILFLINGLCAKVSYDCGFSSTREKFRLALLPLLVILFVFWWVILAAGIFSFSLRSNVEDALHDGLLESMSRYKANLAVKIALDKLQMQARCCGSRSYEDWFNIGWINTEYVNTKDQKVKANMKDGQIYTASVPFSCCSVRSKSPCVWQNVKEFKSENGLTIYANGCTTTLMDSLENKVLYPTGVFVFVLFGAQVLITILMRYLQTSIQGAQEEGDPEGPGMGYLLPGLCPAGCSSGDPDKYVKAGALDRMRGIEPTDTTDRSADDTAIDMDESFDGFSAGVHATGGTHMPDDGGGGGADDDDGAGAENKQKSKQKDKNKSQPKDKKKEKSKSPKKEKTPKKEKSKSPKSPKKEKTPKKETSKSPKSTKKEKTPKKEKSKSPKKAKSPKKERSKSPKRARSPKKPKSPKKSKSPKRAKSPKRGSKKRK